MQRLRFVIITGAASILLSTLSAFAQEDSRALPPARSLRELELRFRQARRPMPDSLVGRWTMVQFIMLNESSDGRRHELHYGARRNDISGEPLEWVLDLRRHSAAQYWVTHHNPWEPTGDSSRVLVRATDITFEKEDGSDYLMVYRCRILGKHRLICLNAKGTAWDGREFTRDP
jgi:hypothetical protein